MADSSTARCRRLAAELHDGALQDLFAAQLELDEALDEGVLWGPARECVERAMDRLREGTTRARALLLALDDPDNPAPSQPPKPELPASVGDEALRDCITRFARRSPTVIDLVSSGTGPPPGSESAHLLLRVVHEGLANVLKHAGASRASVHVERGTAQWAIQVHDDGSGDPQQLRGVLTNHGPAAYGLRSLREDTRDAGGQLWVGRSRILGGVALGAAAPISAPSRAEPPLGSAGDGAPASRP